MADYRQIHTSIWDDDWFCQLTSDEKIVFVWLFSNRRASVSGIYKFTEFICSRETGISLPDVKKAVQRLIEDQKIYIEGEWVWVKNLRKYNDSKSPNSYKRIAADLEMLPDNGLRKAYMAYYKDMASTYQAPTKPLQGDTNRPLEQEQEKEKEHEQEKEQETAPRDSFEVLQEEFFSIGIIPAGEGDIKAINKMVETGVIPEDIQNGLAWKAENNGGKPVRYLSQLVGPINTALSKRLQIVSKKEVSFPVYNG